MALNPRSKVFSPSAYSHGDDDFSNEASQMSGLYGAGLTGYQGYSSFDSHWQHEVTEAPRSFGKGGKAYEQERKAGCGGGVLAELLNDGRLGGSGFDRGRSAHDDWAKDPDAFSSQPTAQARPSYGGIAAELANDGRLWADRWSSQGYGYEPQKGKGHDHGHMWGEWRGASAWDGYDWAPKGKGKHGKSKKGKEVSDKWYGWSKGDMQDWQPHDDVSAYHHEPQVQAWQGALGPQDGFGQKPKARRKRRAEKFDKGFEDLGAEEREVLFRARRSELSAEKEPEVMIAPRLLKTTNWEQVVADEHLCCWMSIQRSNPFVLEEDLQTLLERAPWKDAPGRSGEATKTAWMVGPECEYAAPWAVVMPEWMSVLMERWLSSMDLDQKQLPNCVEVNWYDAKANETRWLSDDDELFKSATQDVDVICVVLGGPRGFRAGLRCGGRKTPIRGTVSEVTLSNGDTCAMEGRFQKHFVHQEFAQVANSTASDCVHVSFRWIQQHSRSCPQQEPGSKLEAEQSEDPSSGSDDLGLE